MERSRVGAMSRLDKRGGLEFNCQGFFSTSVCSFDEYNHHQKRQKGNGMNEMNDRQAVLLQGLLHDTELQFEQFSRQQGYSPSQADANAQTRPIETIPEEQNTRPKRTKSRSRSQTVPNEVDFTDHNIMDHNLQDNLSKSYNINSHGNFRPQRKRTPKQYSMPSQDLAYAFHNNLNILDGAPGNVAPPEMLFQKQTVYKQPDNKENLAESIGNSRSNRTSEPHRTSKLGSKSAIDWAIDQEVERRLQQETERPLHVGQDIIYINNKPFQVLARDPGSSLDTRHLSLDKSQNSPGRVSNSSNSPKGENVSNNNRHSLSKNKHNLRSASLGNFQGETQPGRQRNRARHKNTYYRPPINMPDPVPEGSDSLDIDYGLNEFNASSHPNTSPVSDIIDDMPQHVISSKQQQLWLQDGEKQGSYTSNSDDHSQKQTYQNWFGDSLSHDSYSNENIPTSSSLKRHRRGKHSNKTHDSNGKHHRNASLKQGQLNSKIENSKSPEKSGNSEPIPRGHGYNGLAQYSATQPTSQIGIINNGGYSTRVEQQQVSGSRGVTLEQPQYSGEVLPQYHNSNTSEQSGLEYHDYNASTRAGEDELIAENEATDVYILDRDVATTNVYDIDRDGIIDETESRTSMIAIQRTSPNPVNDGLGTKPDRPKSSKLRSRKPPPVEDTFTTAVSGNINSHKDLKLELGDLASKDSKAPPRKAKRYIPEPESAHAPQPQILKKREKVGTAQRPQSAWRRGFKDTSSNDDDSDVDGEIEILDLDIIEPFSDDEGRAKPVVMVHDETGSTTSSDRVMTPRLTEREMCDLRLEKMHSVKKCRRRFLSDSSIAADNDDPLTPDTNRSPEIREGNISATGSEQSTGITPELVYQHYGNRVVDNYRRRAASDVSILAESNLMAKVSPKEKPAKLKPLVPHGGSASNSSDGDSARDNRLLPPLSKKPSKKKHKKADTTSVLLSKPPVPSKGRTKLNPLPHGDGNTLSVNLSDVDPDNDELENESRRLEREIAKLRSLALNRTPRSPDPRNDLDSDKFFSSTEREKTMGHAQETMRNSLAKSRADLAHGGEHSDFLHNKGDWAAFSIKTYTECFKISTNGGTETP